MAELIDGNRVRLVNVLARMVAVVAALAAVMVVSVAALPLPLLVPTLSRTLLVPLAGASEKLTSPKTLMPGNVVRALGIPPTSTLAVVTVGGTTATVPVPIALLVHRGRMTPALGTAHSLATETSLAGPFMKNGKMRKSVCPSTSERFSQDSHGWRKMMARRSRLRRSWRMITLAADGAR